MKMNLIDGKANKGCCVKVIIYVSFTLNYTKKKERDCYYKYDGTLISYNEKVVAYLRS